MWGGLFSFFGFFFSIVIFTLPYFGASSCYLGDCVVRGTYSVYRKRIQSVRFFLLSLCYGVGRLSWRVSWESKMGCLFGGLTGRRQDYRKGHNYEWERKVREE